LAQNKHIFIGSYQNTDMHQYYYELQIYEDLIYGDLEPVRLTGEKIQRIRTYLEEEIGFCQDMQILKLKFRKNDLQVLEKLNITNAHLDIINIRAGLPALIRKEGSKAFDKLDRVMCQNEPGIWSHSNVQSHKLDVSPQENLIQMLIEL
jgi:hypothetical protein